LTVRRFARFALVSKKLNFVLIAQGLVLTVTPKCGGVFLLAKIAAALDCYPLE
jgi:hypothetical protein